MKYYTISEAAKYLKVGKGKMACWFNNKSNPLEDVSGIKIERINGRILISEDIVEAYVNFINNYMTCKEISSSLGLLLQDVSSWVSRRQSKGHLRVKKIGGTNYIHKDDIVPLKAEACLDISNCMNTTEMMEYLQVHRCTVLDAIQKNRIANGFRYKEKYYAPKDSVEQYKRMYLLTEDSSKYFSISEAAEILGHSTRAIRVMINNPRIDISSKKSTLRKTNYLLKSDVYTFKKFLDDIPNKYYTVQQIMDKYCVSRSYVSKLLSTHLVEKIKWVLLSQQWERVVLISEFDVFYVAYDKYRTEKTIDPHSIFNNGVSTTISRTHLSETKKLYLDFVSLKLNTSRSSLQVQRMFAREYVFLFQTLMSLEKELFLFNDKEIKWLLRTTSNTNQQKKLVTFLLYLQERVHTKYHEKYRVTLKKKENRDKDIYSLDEFIIIEKYLKNIELHLLDALKNRSYAVTWLYTSLHLTNAWRSSDFLRLPSTDISLINVNDFQWFYAGNRLSIEQSQRIINTYAHKRLKVSKTGALNRLLINQDMLVPISTMIVICELHRRKENEQFLLTTEKLNYILIKKRLLTFFPDSIRFSSRKMNRSFMTHLFYKAAESSQSIGVALNLVQQTRRHKKQDSAAIYIQSTDRDGPIGNATLNLCNRGHFGYLYNLLIERSFALTGLESKDTLYERSLKILEYKTVFSTPYDLEQFGEFLRAQMQERESLAVRVALMSPEEAESILREVHMDKMPGHTEHTQCFIYPNCTNPTAISCVGCPNMISKNYLLLSIGIELHKRIAVLNGTNNPTIMCREKAWIQRILILLQEATDTYGIEYTKTFIDYDNLLASVSSAYHHQHSLQKEEIGAVDGG